jgi:uncharacterized membrane protein (DUF373 family)
MTTPRLDGPSERLYLRVVDQFEQIIAKILGVLLLVLIVLASVELLRQMVDGLLQGKSLGEGETLLVFFGELLNILIALELLQNLTAYLQRHAVQIQLVLLTAITAVARKLIVLPGTADSKPLMVVALGLCVLCLAGAYGLIRGINPVAAPAKTTPTRSSPEADRWPPAGGDETV